MNQRPKVFIGSSVEGLNVAYAVQQNLTHSAEVTVWDQGVFELSQTTIESLINILDKSDFGIFIFSPDDIIKIKNIHELTVRDNVIFELGLFIGKLGRNRSFIIIPDKTIIHIPTDLLGITNGKYESERSDNSMQAATGPVCNQIKQIITKIGPFEKDIENSATSIIIPETTEGREIKDEFLINFIDGNYVKALSILENQEIDKKDEKEYLNNQLWQVYCKSEIKRESNVEIINAFLLNTQSEKAYIVAAKFLHSRHLLDKALEILETAINKYPNNFDLHLEKISILLKEELFDEAIEILSTQSIHNPLVLTNLTIAYEKKKELELAFNTIRKAYREFPDLEAVIFKYAQIAYDLEKYEISLFLYDRLINMAHDNVQYWGYLGNTCLSLNLFDKALAAYRKADQIGNGKEQWIVANIGNILSGRGFYTEANSYFQKALEMDKNDEYTIKRLSSLLEFQTKENDKYNSMIKEGKSTIRNYNSNLNDSE